jgi:putative ABC transport system substrate-binding protein
MAAELSAKRLELLRELVPGAKRVAMLFNASDPAMTARYRAAETVAPALGTTLQRLGVREPEEFDTAFEAMKKDLPDGIMMVTDVLTNLNRKRVFEFAADHHLAAIFELCYMVREGGLMAYGVDRAEASERAADIVVRILNGANPADLPIERPTRFHLTVNLTIAKNLGLAFPESLLLQADEVVE